MKSKCFSPIKSALIVMAVVTVCVFFTSQGFAATTLLNPTADAYVDQNQPEKNYGANDLLDVASHLVIPNKGPAQHKNRRTVLQFDLSPIPGNCTITGATLELYIVAQPPWGQGGRIYELWFSNYDDWYENTVTWISQPQPDSETVLLDSVPTPQAPGTMSWGYPNRDEQLTQAVTAEYSGDKKISLIIKDSAEDNTSGARVGTFASKENTQYPKPALRIEYECPSAEGCSHGFWKNHPEMWSSTYSPATLLKNVFSNSEKYTYTKTTGKETVSYNLGDKTLMDALEFPGGNDTVGAAMILLRNGVAALLNAAHSDVYFSLNVEDVTSAVNNALETEDRDTMLSLESQLDALNNLGCPLDD